LTQSGSALLGSALLTGGGPSAIARLVGSASADRAADRADEPNWKDLLADLDRQIPRLMREAGVPGLSLAIVRDGRIRWRRAYGVVDVATMSLVDADTLFEAASTSKPLFAYAVMKLRERGIIDLDTPLTRYATDRFVTGDPRIDLITARHCLSHTSGLPNWRSPDTPLGIAFKPGTQWSYSGEGYYYLQSVFTHLIGDRVDSGNCAHFEMDVAVCATLPGIDRYMRKRELEPFGMMSSGYLWNSAMQSHMARGHDPQGKRLETDRRPNGPGVARYGMAGGLCTTPSDYARFLIQVLDPTPADAFRLSETSIGEMLRPQIRRNPGSSWALGWEIEHTADGDFIRHGGGNPGFSCFVAGSVPRKAGYVIMTNSEDNGYLGVIAKLISGDALSPFIGGKLRAASE
jgi:CubicO group peptidase (beta-lactamase class C family)